MRMLAPLILAAAITLGSDPDAEAAYADWVAMGKGHYAYATVSTEANQPRKERLARQLAFVACSLSSKQYLGDQLPVKINENLYRLDLQGLGWARVWPEVLRRYPYRPDLGHRYPLVVRADWIVADLTDPTVTFEAQQLLLYGRALKNAKEFEQHWKANTANVEAYAFIEGASGVQSQGQARLMVNHDTAQRSRLFVTFDSINVSGKRDPLENLPLGTLAHDGREYIAGIPKHYQGEGGSLQAYLLANGRGEVVNEAPPRLVKDTLNFRGPEIRNTNDCISCHVSGMQYPSVDEYRRYVLSGAKVYADYKTKQELERLYESPFVKELDRQNEDYAVAIRLVNGLTPEKNTAEFRGVVESYDAPVTLSQAAREVYCTPEELRLAIANYSPRITGRLAILAEGKSISRDQWKENIKAVLCEVLPSWRVK